ncbi:hypothetical protein GCM10022289_34280 [Pedobacter jeongneungensis]|uniref:Lipoprotein n=1 Tax=Pedobacter jeongneungensis TaxID=947309 RepID=A0ABP8BL60_9SPHI
MNKFRLFIILAILSGCQLNSSKTNGSSDTSLPDSNSLNIDSAGNPIHLITTQDSAKIKLLLKSFKITKDEFDVDDKQWVRPIDEPHYVNRNGIYSYFQSNEGVASNLRFVIQYYNDDWLFIQKYQFSIDGKAYEYIPNKVETDSGDGGMIWEWFDDQADENLKKIMEAIVKSKTTKIKMIGNQYFDIKTVTSKQKESIRKTLELYKLQGGN